VFEAELKHIDSLDWHRWNAIREEVSSLTVVLRNGRLRASCPPTVGRRCRLFLNALTPGGGPLVARFDPLPRSEFALRLSGLRQAAEKGRCGTGPGEESVPARTPTPVPADYPEVPLADAAIEDLVEAGDIGPLLQLAAAVPRRETVGAMACVTTVEAERRVLELVLPHLTRSVRDTQTTVRLSVVRHFPEGLYREVVERRRLLSVADVPALTSPCLSNRPQGPDRATGPATDPPAGFPPTECPVRLEPRAISYLLRHLLLPLLDVGSPAGSTGCLSGGRVGSRCLGSLTLVDDATLPYAPGSRRFDYEGSPSRRNVLFADGVFLRPLGTAAACAARGFEPSGSVDPDLRVAYTNLELVAPRRDDSCLEEEALVVPGLSGFSFGYRTGDFVLDAETAYCLETGPRDEAARSRRHLPVTVAGNLFELFADPRTRYGPVAVVDNLTLPHVVTRSVTLKRKV